MSYTKSRFHVTHIALINKPVVYFYIRGYVKFGYSKNANLCTKFDLKSGLIE